jgi:predicted DCC family thiol-disulfide oxidoreductase YuxK
MRTRLPDHITVMFDGTCDFCTWSAQLIDWLDRQHRIRLVPFQAAGALVTAGLSQPEAEAAAWAITPGGERYRGAAAVNLALAVALGSRLPLVLYRLPGLRQLQDAAYAVVASHRHRLPGVRPYCQEYPETCRKAG